MIDRPQTAALGTLIILQGVMLAALFTKTAPHPPEVIPLGGMGPFLGAAMSAAMAAVVVGPGSRAGHLLSLAACLLALVSFGPQKFFDPAFALVWPAVITAQIAVVSLAAIAFKTLTLDGRSQ